MIKYSQDIEDYRKFSFKANYKIKCFSYLKWKAIFYDHLKVLISMMAQSKHGISSLRKIVCWFHIITKSYKMQFKTENK